MGAFVCLELARRKLSVLGLDQFTPPHGRGSHSGATRIFRVAYAEHPDYVPLAQRAGLLWDRLGEKHGSALLHRTGMLSIGEEDSAVISGIRASAAAHHLPIENLTIEQIRSRYPAFAPAAGSVGLFDPSAGWIDVDPTLRFVLEQAAREGAQLRLDTRVSGWEANGREFLIHTETETFRARRLIITAGVWAGRLLADLRLPLKVLRRVMIWVDPIRPEMFSQAALPVFAFAEKFFYGFPAIRDHGVKLAIHWGEASSAGEIDAPQPEPTGEEIEPVLEIAARLIPSLAGSLPGARNRLLGAKTCLYALTPDEHFFVDRHPRIENVCFAAGFSGHGFKFAPAIGEALAQMSMNIATTSPIDFLGIHRRA
jgi:sarcosine oxidase